MQNLTLCSYSSTLFDYLLQSIAYGLLAVAVATSSGCAVHYYDAESNIEHVWGIGHMSMKPSPAMEGVVAIGRRTDVIGLSFASIQEQLDVTLGWNAKQRIDIAQEDAKLCLDWPQGSFYNARVGTNFPQAASTCGATPTKR
jgi:hypothetical protein